MKLKSLFSIIMGICIITCCIVADLSKINLAMPASQESKPTDEKVTETNPHSEITIIKNFEQEKVSITFNQAPFINEDPTSSAFISPINDKFAQIFYTKVNSDDETIDQFIENSLKNSKTMPSDGEIQKQENTQFHGYSAKIIEVKYPNGLYEKSIVIKGEKRFYAFLIIGHDPNSNIDKTALDQEFQKFTKTTLITKS